MGKKEFAKYVMNSTRQRIIQSIIFARKASTSDIAKILDDIPQATLYRNIKSLLDNGFIEIVEEKNIRGVVEKYYSPAKNKVFSENPTNKELNDVIQGLLFEIGRSFKTYFSDSNNDSIKDMLGLWNATLILSDEEYTHYLNDLNELIKRYIGKEKTPDRKIRNICTISLPSKGEKNERTTN